MDVIRFYRRSFEPSFCAGTHQLIQTSSYRLNVLDPKHRSGDMRIRRNRFVLAIKRLNCQRRHQPSGTNHLDAILINLDLNATVVRVIAMGDRIVDRLRDDTVRNLIHTHHPTSAILFDFANGMLDLANKEIKLERRLGLDLIWIRHDDVGQCLAEMLHKREFLFLVLFLVKFE